MGVQDGGQGRGAKARAAGPCLAGAGFPFAVAALNASRGNPEAAPQRPQQVPSQGGGHWHVKGEVRLTPAFRVLRGESRHRN